MFSQNKSNYKHKPAWVGPFWAPGHNLNKFGKGIVDYDTYQIPS